MYGGAYIAATLLLVPSSVLTVAAGKRAIASRIARTLVIAFAASKSTASVLLVDLSIATACVGIEEGTRDLLIPAASQDFSSDPSLARSQSLPPPRSGVT